jgi:hypothetical protein
VELGRSEKGFAWRPFAKYVTRIAISPLFVAPWVEPTRDVPDELTAVVEKFKKFRTDRDSGVLSGQCQWEKPKCRVCSKEGTKMCGKCKKVGYCSRDCQVKDNTRGLVGSHTVFFSAVIRHTCVDEISSKPSVLLNSLNFSICSLVSAPPLHRASGTRSCIHLRTPSGRSFKYLSHL